MKKLKFLFWIFLNKFFLNGKQSNSNLKIDDDLSNFEPKENLKQIINCFNMIKKRKFPKNLLSKVENYLNVCPKNKYIITESK